VFEAAGEEHRPVLLDWFTRVKKINGGPTRESDAVCDYIDDGGVDTSLDNKILGDAGRVNPVVLGLDVIGENGEALVARTHC
jgi:hypothetical protein